MTWDVWGDADRRRGLRVRAAALPGAVDGVWAQTILGDRLIVLDSGLEGAARTEVLAHELVHDDRCGGCAHPSMPPSWSAVVARDERSVDEVVARRLVPRAELIEAIRGHLALGEGTSDREIAEVFGVSNRIARRALTLLYDETGGLL